MQSTLRSAIPNLENTRVRKEKIEEYINLLLYSWVHANEVKGKDFQMETQKLLIQSQFLERAGEIKFEHTVVGLDTSTYAASF